MGGVVGNCTWFREQIKRLGGKWAAVGIKKVRRSPSN